MAYQLSAVMNLSGNFAAQMQKNMQAVQDVKGKVTGLNDAVKNTKLGQMGQKMSQGLSLAKDAIGATGLAAAGFLKGCIDGAAKGQKINADLAQTIKSTGGAAGLTADQVSKMAAEFSKTTTFGAGAIKTGQNMLLTFTNIGKDVFPMATQAMLDLSQKMGTDPVGSSIQLGKALNDPIKGITALTRVGVTFTEQQKKQIEAMQNAGNIAGAQKIILNELNKEFGGQAAAAAQTYEGRLKQLQNTIGSIKGSIGSALLPYVQKAAEFFLGLAQKVQSVPKPIIEVVAKVLGLTAVFGTLIGGIGLLQKVMMMAVPQISMFGNMFSKLKGSIGIIAIVLAGLTYAYIKNLGGFKDFMDGMFNKASTAISAIVAAFNSLKQTGSVGEAAAKQLESAFGKSLGANIRIILTGLSDAIKVVTAVIKGDFAQSKTVISAWSESGNTNMIKFLNTVRTLGTIVRTVILTIVALFTGNFKTVETTLVQGFGMSASSVQKFVSTFQTIRSVAINILNTLGEVVKNVFGFIVSHGSGIIEILKLIAKGFMVIKIGIAIFNAIKIAVAAFNIIMGVARGIIMAVRLAQLALNIAFMINPVGVIIAAIVAFIAILVILWNKNAAFRNFIISCWNGIKAGVSAVVHALGAAIKQAWEGIKNAVTVTINAIKFVIVTVFNAIKTVVLAIVTPLANGILNIFNNMKAGLSGMLSGLKNIFQGAWNLIKLVVMGPVLLILDLVTGNFSKLKSDAIKIMQGIFNSLKQIWSGICQFVIGFARAIVGFVVGAFQNAKNNIITVWNTVGSFLHGLWTGLCNLCKAAWNGMCSAISSILSSIWNFICNAWNGILNFFTSLPSKLYQHGVSIITGLKNGIVSIMSTVSSAIKDGLNGAIDFIKNLPAKFLEWGADMIKGLANGIKNTISHVTDAVSGVANKIRSFLHFSRPDTGPLAVYEEWMPDFMKGMAGGIRSNTKLVTDATRDVAVGINNNVKPKRDPQGGSPTAASKSNGGVVLNIPKLADSIVIREDADIDKLATAFVKKIKGAGFNMV